MIDLLLYAVPLVAGLAALLFAPVVDRWAERLDVWVEGRLNRRPKVQMRADNCGVFVQGLDRRRIALPPVCV